MTESKNSTPPLNPSSLGFSKTTLLDGCNWVLMDLNFVREEKEVFLCPPAIPLRTLEQTKCTEYGFECLCPHREIAVIV